MMTENYSALIKRNFEEEENQFLLFLYGDKVSNNHSDILHNCFRLLGDLNIPSI